MKNKSITDYFKVRKKADKEAVQGVTNKPKIFRNEQLPAQSSNQNEVTEIGRSPGLKPLRSFLPQVIPTYQRTTKGIRRKGKSDPMHKFRRILSYQLYPAEVNHNPIITVVIDINGVKGCKHIVLSSENVLLKMKESGSGVTRFTNVAQQKCSLIHRQERVFYHRWSDIIDHLREVNTKVCRNLENYISGPIFWGPGISEIQWVNNQMKQSVLKCQGIQNTFPLFPWGDQKLLHMDTNAGQFLSQILVRQNGTLFNGKPVIELVRNGTLIRTLAVEEPGRLLVFNKRTGQAVEKSGSQKVRLSNFTFSAHVISLWIESEWNGIELPDPTFLGATVVGELPCGTNVYHIIVDCDLLVKKPSMLAYEKNRCFYRVKENDITEKLPSSYRFHFTSNDSMVSFTVGQVLQVLFGIPQTLVQETTPEFQDPLSAISNEICSWEQIHERLDNELHVFLRQDRRNRDAYKAQILNQFDSITLSFLPLEINGSPLIMVASHLRTITGYFEKNVFVLIDGPLSKFKGFRDDGRPIHGFYETSRSFTIRQLKHYVIFAAEENENNIPHTTIEHKMLDEQEDEEEEEEEEDLTKIKMTDEKNADVVITTFPNPWAHVPKHDKFDYMNIYLRDERAGFSMYPELVIEVQMPWWSIPSVKTGIVKGGQFLITNARNREAYRGFTFINQGDKLWYGNNDLIQFIQHNHLALATPPLHESWINIFHVSGTYFSVLIEHPEWVNNHVVTFIVFLDPNGKLFLVDEPTLKEIPNHFVFRFQQNIGSNGKSQIVDLCLMAQKLKLALLDKIGKNNESDAKKTGDTHQESKKTGDSNPQHELGEAPNAENYVQLSPVGKEQLGKDEYVRLHASTHWGLHMIPEDIPKVYGTSVRAKLVLVNAANCSTTEKEIIAYDIIVLKRYTPPIPTGFRLIKTQTSEMDPCDIKLKRVGATTYESFLGKNCTLHRRGISIDPYISARNYGLITDHRYKQLKNIQHEKNRAAGYTSRSTLAFKDVKALNFEHTTLKGVQVVQVQHTKYFLELLNRDKSPDTQTSNDYALVKMTKGDRCELVVDESRLRLRVSPPTLQTFLVSTTLPKLINSYLEVNPEEAWKTLNQRYGIFEERYLVSFTQNSVFSVSRQQTMYTSKSNGYIRIFLDQTNWFLHRLVYFVRHGVIHDWDVIDHKNGIREDNTPENLRMVPQSVNCLNRNSSAVKYERTITGLESSIHFVIMNFGKRTYRIFDTSRVEVLHYDQYIEVAQYQSTQEENGYRRILIHGGPECGRKSWRVHRLVYHAFHPNEVIDTKVINHINHNKSDNSLHNLELCTQQENVQAYWKHTRGLDYNFLNEQAIKNGISVDQQITLNRLNKQREAIEEKRRLSAFFK